MKPFEIIPPPSGTSSKYSREKQGDSQRLPESARSTHFLISVSGDREAIENYQSPSSPRSPVLNAALKQMNPPRFIRSLRVHLLMAFLIIALIGLKYQLATSPRRNSGERSASSNPEIVKENSIEDEEEAIRRKGQEAEEKAYSMIGSTNLIEYQKEILTFYDSILAPSLHHNYVNLENVLNNRISIPRVIHQTGPSEALTREEDETMMADLMNSWKRFNPKHDYHFLNDSGSDEWIQSSFHSNEQILKLWSSFETLPVIRADIYRYLRLIRSGGIYSDLDTMCLKPINLWNYYDHQPAGVFSPMAELSLIKNFDRPPQIIVGIEADVGTRSDWYEWWPRPIQIAQWTIAAIPNHPILIDTLRRIYQHYQDSTIEDLLNLLHDTRNPATVLEVVNFTGPGPFTDSVLRYIQTISFNQIDWRFLKDLPPQGLRIGDCLILPISAFSPGIGSMGSRDIDYEYAYVHHRFAGSWKNQKRSQSLNS